MLLSFEKQNKLFELNVVETNISGPDT